MWSVVLIIMTLRFMLCEAIKNQTIKITILLLWHEITILPQYEVKCKLQNRVLMVNNHWGSFDLSSCGYHTFMNTWLFLNLISIEIKQIILLHYQSKLIVALIQLLQNHARVGNKSYKTMATKFSLVLIISNFCVIKHTS